jgi:hypothetical protein
VLRSRRKFRRKVELDLYSTGCFCFHNGRLRDLSSGNTRTISDGNAFVVVLFFDLSLQCCFAHFAITLFQSLQCDDRKFWTGEKPVYGPGLGLSSIAHSNSGKEIHQRLLGKINMPRTYMQVIAIM